MKNVRTVVLACVVLASSLAADVVYMRDGKIYEGVATRRGDRVIVRMKYATVALDAADVRLIVKAALTSRPDESLSGAPAQAPAAGKALGVGSATRPEPVAFGLMRVLAATGPGAAERSFSLRRQVRRWQDAAHDRLRKIGGQWYGPGEFENRRRAFTVRLAESQEIFRRIARVRRDDPAGNNERRRLRTAAAVKAATAARVWPDLLLRRFLTGVADYRADRFRPAEIAFRRCLRQAPLVAAFHQAHGMALMKIGRPLDALAALTAALRLKPDSPVLLAQLTAAMAAVPAARTRTATYIIARKLAGQYEQPRRQTAKSRQLRWLLPGKVRQTPSSILPVPSYDRIDFKQAAGVAVGPNALLVDARAVRNAADVYLKIADGRYVPARVNRGSYRPRGKAAVPLAIVSVRDVVLTPVKLAATVIEKLPPGLNVAVYALPLYASMGTVLAPIDAVTLAPDARRAVPVSAKLSAGDAASPVIDAGGRLLGFLTGKTDVTASGGGPDGFIGPTDLESLIKRASRIGLGGRGHGYAAAKRTFIPEPVKGNVFVIYAVECETVK